jgi:hypothetical protein
MFTIHRAAGPGVVTSGDTVWLEVDNGQYWSVISGGSNPIYANKSSVGPMEEFIITLAANPAHYPPPPDAFVWIDHDNDGTRDQIIKSGSTLFTVSIDSWYTSCYDYWWYPINDYFDPWGYTWGSLWDTTPGFSRILMTTIRPWTHYLARGWSPDKDMKKHGNYNSYNASNEPKKLLSSLGALP